MRSVIFYYCLAQTRAADRDGRAPHDPPARVRTTRRALLRRRRGSSSSDSAGTIKQFADGHQNALITEDQMLSSQPNPADGSGSGCSDARPLHPDRPHQVQVGAVTDSGSDSARRG